MRSVPFVLSSIWTALRSVLRVAVATFRLAVGVIGAVARTAWWVALWLTFPRACLALRLLRRRR